MSFVASFLKTIHPRGKAKLQEGFEERQGKAGKGLAMLREEGGSKLGF